MVAAKDQNGARWPEDLQLEPVEISAPADGASDRERARAYGTAMLRISSVLPKMIQALNFLREAGQQTAFDAIGARTEAAAANATAKRIEDMMKGLPPMRAESSSSHDMLERFDDKVTASFAQRASKTPGPMLEGSPDDLAAIAKSAAAQVMLEERARIKGEADRQRLADLEAADEQRKKELADAVTQRKNDLHKLKQKVIAAVAVWAAVGLVGIIVGIFWVGAKVVAARELGHAEAVREMHSAAAPAPSRTETTP
jgi:hypothetical protein